jgi:pimeloyl-ACP methyl ester carboxylesterase
MEMKKLFANGYKKFDYSDSMPRITCPVLWFAGEWDPLHPACCAQEGAKKLTQVDLHILPTGAPVYQDNPDAFYQEVSIFLQKLGVECRSIPCGRLNQ